MMVEFFRRAHPTCIGWYAKIHNWTFPHRTDGPAIEHRDGTIEWWMDGVHCSFEEWLSWSSLPIEEKALLKLRYG